MRMTILVQLIFYIADKGFNMREQIEALIESCPCPVIFKNRSDDSTLSRGAAGYFERGSSPIVVIRYGFTDVESFVILAHETAHAKCFFGRCYCYNGYNLYLKEYHAFTAQITASMNHKEAAIVTINNVSNIVDIPLGRKSHQSACRDLMETELWSDLLLVAGDSARVRVGV